MLQFEDMDLGNQAVTMECVLKAMELDEEEEVEVDLDDSMTQEDEETMQLPKEWVYDLSFKRKNSLEDTLKAGSMDWDQEKSAIGGGEMDSNSCTLASAEEDDTSYTQPNLEGAERQNLDAL